MRKIPLFALLTLAGVTVATPGTAGSREIPSILQQVRIGDMALAPNTGMSPPIALVHPAPKYTVEALSSGVEGTVTVRAEFDIDGNFEILEVVKGLPFGLNEMAFETLKSWRFRPAYRSGRRVPVVARACKESRVREPYNALFEGRDVWRRRTMGFHGSCWTS